ncbi:unnamed protein product [Closterium sp. NIES-54]
MEQEQGGGDSVSARTLLLPDGTEGDVAATATAASAKAASATAATALPLLDLLQLGLVLTALQEKLGRIDAAMLSAALFALFHLSLSLLFPNMALGISAGLLAGANVLCGCGTRGG